MIILKPENCKGCKICEMACSFHHTKHSEFRPTLSSTKSIKNNNKGEITLTIDSSCDLCNGEEVALCVKYCAYGARGVLRR